MALPLSHVTRCFNELLERDVSVAVAAGKVAAVIGGLLEKERVAGGECRVLRGNGIPAMSLVYSDVAIVAAVKETLLAVCAMRFGDGRTTQTHTCGRRSGWQTMKLCTKPRRDFRWCGCATAP